jgi:hypothetical protein
MTASASTGASHSDIPDGCVVDAGHNEVGSLKQGLRQHHLAAAYATAPCSGLGQQVPGMQPPTYWNGCACASAGPNGPTTTWDAVDFFHKPGGPLEFYTNGPFVMSNDAWIYTGSNDRVVPHC